jgi:hypothetical protein
VSAKQHSTKKAAFAGEVRSRCGAAQLNSDRIYFFMQADFLMEFVAAADVNATRKCLVAKLRQTGLPISTFSGGLTKFNRVRLLIPKTHALDASCVGRVSELKGWAMPVFYIKATGRGAYQRTRVTKKGFPRGYLPRTKTVHGFRTGDQVQAVVAKGKKRGVHTGRVAVRSSGSFNIQTPKGPVQGISYRHCRCIYRGDGYSYRQVPIQYATFNTSHA